MSVRAVVNFARFMRHLFRVWRGGQLRFRLETYGVYFPSLPYSVPIWRVSLRNVFLLLAQTRSYSHWVREMEDIQGGDAASWWETNSGIMGRVPEDWDEHCG